GGHAQRLVNGSAIQTVAPAAATLLTVGAPANVTTGTAFTITLTALDPYNNRATGYQGTVNFTSSDPAAVLPPPYPFTAGDAGTHTFTNGVTLNTTGGQTVTATDSVMETV